MNFFILSFLQILHKFNVPMHEISHVNFVFNKDAASFATDAK